MIPFSDSTGMIYIHCVPPGQAVNKEYYVEFLREFRKWFRRKRPALFKSGQWHFHQDNAPVHNSILVTDYLTKTGTKFTYLDSRVSSTESDITIRLVKAWNALDRLTIIWRSVLSDKYKEFFSKNLLYWCYSIDAARRRWQNAWR